jgi:hypothetical protein
MKDLPLREAIDRLQRHQAGIHDRSRVDVTRRKGSTCQSHGLESRCMRGRFQASR